GSVWVAGAAGAAGVLGVGGVAGVAGVVAVCVAQPASTAANAAVAHVLAIRNGTAQTMRRVTIRSRIVAARFTVSKYAPPPPDAGPFVRPPAPAQRVLR